MNNKSNMNTHDFEKIIRESLNTQAIPHRKSFAILLEKLPDNPVTKNAKIRYTRETWLSNIINNTASLVTFWKSKQMLLIPSLMLVLFVGIFSFFPKSAQYDQTIPLLAQEDERIEEPGLDLDDTVNIAFYDTPAINELATTTNEF